MYFQLHYDHQVLLDYLISKDTGTSCAEYLLRFGVSMIFFFFVISLIYYDFDSVVKCLFIFIIYLYFFTLGACVQSVIRGTYF